MRQRARPVDLGGGVVRIERQRLLQRLVGREGVVLVHEQDPKVEPAFGILRILLNQRPERLFALDELSCF